MNCNCFAADIVVIAAVAATFVICAALINKKYLQQFQFEMGIGLLIMISTYVIILI